MILVPFNWIRLGFASSILAWPSYILVLALLYQGPANHPGYTLLHACYHGVIHARTDMPRVGYGHRAPIRAIHATPLDPAVGLEPVLRPINPVTIASLSISGRERSNCTIVKDRVGLGRVRSSSDRVVLTYPLINASFRVKSGRIQPKRVKN